DVAGGSGALLDGVLPMFDSDLAVEDRVMVIRHITSSINAADVCLAICIDDYAIVGVNAAALEHFHGRFDADAGNHEIAVKTQTCLCDDGGHACGSLERCDRVLQDYPHAVCAMKIGDSLPDFFTEHAEERRLR